MALVPGAEKNSDKEAGVLGGVGGRSMHPPETKE